MFTFLNDLLGNYSYQFIVQGVAVIQPIITAFIFAIPLQHKKHYIPRVAVSLLIMLAILSVSTSIRTDFNNLVTRIIVSIIQYGITLPLLFLCYETSAFSALQTWCMSIATSEVTACFYWFLLALSGTDTANSISFFNYPINADLEWMVYWSIHGICYLGLYWVFGRSRTHEHDERELHDMALLSLMSVLSQVLLNSISGEFRTESAMLYGMTRLFSMSMSALVLTVGSYIVRQQQNRAETALMEQTILSERQQYQRMKDNIDIINMRCHDLKHQLANFSGKLTEEEVKALQEAVNIYDSTIKTGNEVLDVLIYEKQLACQQEGILLTCLADGKALSFMRTRHVYALFDNAVSNAIEAVRQLPDPEMKVISLNVSSKNGMVEIVTTNYFAGSVQFSDGLPNTTKANKNQHGFGSMSIRYIAEQYGGTMNAEAENDIYTMTVRIPVPNVLKAA